jgi:hypothetical protein
MDAIEISVMREVIQFAEDVAYAHVTLSEQSGVFPRLDPSTDTYKLFQEKFPDLPSSHGVYAVLFQEVFARIVNATQLYY